MSRLIQTIALALEYPVYMTRDLFAPENPDLRDAIQGAERSRRQRVLAVVDAGLAAANPGLRDALARYAQAHEGALALVRTVVMPGGEACKNDPSVVGSLLDLLARERMDRHAHVLVLGGGAVLDVVGYGAAITHRGIRCVRVPTTVLAQADSGVGVKNGVNAFGQKNFLGTFVPPHAVLIDPGLLATLSPRDRIAGMAEAVKVALVRDGELFDWLESATPRLRAFELDAVEQLVRRSAELHLAHIARSGDPFERGSARPLDFGHWAAHKLETMTDHRLRHGEAVAIGMALDALYSAAIGLCSREVADRVCALLSALGFALWDDALGREDGDGRLVVLSGLSEFREHLGGELTITLLERIGRGREVHAMDEALLSRLVRELRERR